MAVNGEQDKALRALAREKLEHFQKERLLAKQNPFSNESPNNISSKAAISTLTNEHPKIVNGIPLSRQNDNSHGFFLLKEQLKSARLEISSANEKFLQLKSQINDQQREKQQISETVERLTSEIDSCRLENDRLRKLNEDSQTQMKSQGEIIANVRSDNARLISEFENVIQQDKSSTVENDSLQATSITNSSVFASQVQEQTLCVDRLMNVVSSEINDHSQNLIELLKQVKILREIVDPLGMVLGSSMSIPATVVEPSPDASEKLKQTLEELAQVHIELQNKINDVQTMQKRVDEVNDEKRILTASLQQSLAEISSNYAAQEQELRVSRKTLSEEKQRCYTLSQEISSTKNRLKERSLESEHLEDRLRAVESPSKQTELDLECQKVNSLLKDKIFLAEQIDSSQKEIKGMSKELSELRQSYLTLASQSQNIEHNGTLLTSRRESSKVGWFFSYFVPSGYQFDSNPIVV